MKTGHFDVVVAGAGPVGLSAALFLHALGHSVTVLDMKPRSVGHSYALALHPETLALLESLDLAGDIIAQSFPVRTLGIYVGGRRIVSVPVAPAGARFPFLAVVGQDVLEAVLGRALSQRGVQIAWNHRLARFTHTERAVKLEVEELEERVVGYAVARLDWSVRRERAIEAKYLIGADGHDSLVRRQCGLQFSEVHPAQHFAVFESQRLQPGGDEMALVLHPDGIAVRWPLPGSRERWSFLVDPAQAGEATREKDHEPVQIIGPGVIPTLDDEMFHRLLRERAPWCVGDHGHVYWKMMVRFEHRLASNFGENRVWLAGDAAHLTSPAGIQSMNVGIREAGALAQAITEVQRLGDGSTALQDYNLGRLLEWRGLLGVEGKVEATPALLPELGPWKTILPGCLPASGSSLLGLAEQIGLRLALGSSATTSAA